MADKSDSKTKSKRRLRAGPETMRSRLEQNTLATTLKPEKTKPEKKKRKIFAPIRVVWRPIRWLARHIVPRYFRSAAHELRLTTWPSRKQSRQLTLAVVIFAVVFGAFVY